MSSISPDPITIRVEVPSPTVLMRAYFSSYYLWAAEHFAQLAADIENVSGRKPRFDIQHRALKQLHGRTASTAFPQLVFNRRKIAYNSLTR
jgi:hypothetical protein